MRVSHVVDFSTLTVLPGIAQIDDVFVALGTTLEVAGSQPTFRAIDFDAVLAVTQAALARGATRLEVISAMQGTESGTRVLLSGEMQHPL